MRGTIMRTMAAVPTIMMNPQSKLYLHGFTTRNNTESCQGPKNCYRIARIASPRYAPPCPTPSSFF